MARHRTRKACPECGGTDTERIEEHRFGIPMTLVPDRLCRDCGTRFSVPLPRLASAALVAGGSLVLVTGAATAALIGWSFDGSRPNNWRGAALSLFLVALGLVTIVQGVRALLRPAEVD